MPSPAIHPVICAVCSTDFKVGRQRFETSKAFTCSKPCLAELRRRNTTTARATDLPTSATCPVCGKSFERKASQLAKYKNSYCGRECRAVGIRGPKPAIRNGRLCPCETCGKEVWRTPATLRNHVYCSIDCTASGRVYAVGPRVVRIIRPCANNCGRRLRLLPSEQTRYCAVKCARQAHGRSQRGTKRGPWPSEQRVKLSATLREKYKNEWMHLVHARSVSMRGIGNPRWRDGRATRPYAPGFNERVKYQVAKRDGFKCRLCGAPKRVRSHVVHHIDGEKHDHRLVNLILLCKSCHGKVHAMMDRFRRSDAQTR